MGKPRLRQFRFIVPLMVLTFALLVNDVCGQEDRNVQAYQFFRADIDRIDKAKYRIGPFRIFPSMRFNMGYDNNVYRSNNPQFMISDFAARISIPVNVYLRCRNWLILSLIEDPDYVYYFATKGLRSWNNSFSSQIRLLLIRRFVISGGYFNSRVRRRSTVEFDAPIYENQRGFTSSIFYEPGGRISLGFSRNIRELEYDEINVAQRLNRRVKTNTLTLYYRFSTGSQIFLRGGFSNFSFQGFTLVSRETDSYWINSGITFPILGRLKGILSFGYSKVMPRDKMWPDFSGLIGNTSLEWNMKRFRFRIDYSRNTSFSHLGSGLYFVNERIGSGISFFLTSFIRLGYDFNYGKAQYPMPASGDMQDDLNERTDRLDIYRTHSARIIFKLIRNTGIGINFNYWERDSNIIGYSRKNTFIFVYLTTSFNL